MRFLRSHLKMILLFGITTLLIACSGGGGDGNDNALEFSDGFESTNVVKVASFSLTHNGITAIVVGGNLRPVSGTHLSFNI